MIFLKRFPFSSRFSRIPKKFQVDQGYQGHHGHQGHQRHQGNQGHQGLMMIGWLTNATSVDTPRLGRANLRAHLNIHSGEKSNKCNQCDYASAEARGGRCSLFLTMFFHDAMFSNS